MRIVSIKPNESTDVATVAPSHNYDFMKSNKFETQVRVGIGSDALYLSEKDWANLQVAVNKAFEASQKIVAKRNKDLEADSDF